MLTEIIISGFGGQGVLFAGKCLAHSAMMKNLQVSWLPSYGPEMRGGTANCSVCLSDEQIGSPLVIKPDILVALNNPSVQKFIDNVKSGGKVFVDSSIADVEILRDDVEIYHIPASQLAEDKGLAGMGNIIILGKIINECYSILGGIDTDIFKDALHEIIPLSKAELIEKNISALQIGKSI